MSKVMADPTSAAELEPQQVGRRRWLAVGGLSALGLAAGLGLQHWRTRPALEPELERFWAQTLDMVDGRKQPATMFRGRPLLLNFWATWCPPCIEEMPLLDAFHLKNVDKGLQMLGIAIDKNQSVTNFLSRLPVHYPIAVHASSGAQWARDLGNLTGGLPYSVFFAPDGSVVRRKMGKLVEADLQSWLNLATARV
jgi:thiol-disulfide isomerase/thioredoxin